MRKVKAAVATSSLTLVVISAAGMMLGSGIIRAATDEPPARFEWKDGAEVYAKVCGYCHEGGPVGPQIRGRELPAAYIRTVVRNGFGAMPPFRAAEIDDESLAKLAEYISKN